jgi:hypothetical protein
MDRFRRQNAPENFLRWKERLSQVGSEETVDNGTSRAGFTDVEETGRTDWACW